MSTDIVIPPLRSRRRLRYLAAALALISAIVLIPNTANAAYNEDCEPGDTKLLGGDTGTQNVSLLECNFSRAWVPTAVYSAAESKLVIWEPRDATFDSPLYSQFNPYTGDFDYKKANDLYPTSSAEKTEFAQKSLTAKALALQAYKNTTSADACPVTPQKYTDDDIRTNGHWLGPTPTPDGKTGYLTYTISPDLTSQQNAGVLAMLSQYDAMQAGSSLPRLVQWTSGDTALPVINFINGKYESDYNSDSTNAEAVPTSTSTGRDGLMQWKTGTITMSETDSIFSPMILGHELLHVFGYHHTIEYPGSPMSPTSNREIGDWQLNGAEPVNENMVAFNACIQDTMKK